MSLFQRRSAPLLCGIDAVSELALVGGKGRSLQELRREGAPVPEAVILTTAFAKAMPAGDAPMPAACEAALREVSVRLGAGPWIVRSSGVGEDGEVSSFAGMLESIFPVDSGDPRALVSALRRVLGSGEAPRVVAYARARGTALTGVAVIVQRLVDCAAAGVLFTDGVLLRGEWCRGHGQALVDGAITPGAFRVDRRFAAGAGRAVVVDRAPDEVGPFPLADEACAALVRFATAIERRRGHAMDLEWCVDPRGALWIVQARAVTGRRSQLFSNANIAENFPAPVTPLLASFARAGYEAYFRNLARELGLDEARIAAEDEAFRGIVSTHGARLYYNLSAIHAVLRLMPFGDWLVDSFDLFVGAGASSPRAAPAEIASLGRVLAHVVLAFRDLDARVSRFERVVDEVAARVHPRLVAGMPQDQLADGLRAIVDVRLHRWLDASLADCAAAVTYRALGTLLGPSSADDDPTARHHALLQGLDVAGAWSMRALWDLADRVHADPRARRALGLGSFAAFRAALTPGLGAQVDDWLDRYGFRGSGELLLTEPSLQEEPDRLLPLLARYVEAIGAGSTDSPALTFERQRAAREAETARLIEGLRGARRGLRPLFTRLVRATQRSVQLRERARFRQALLYTRLRVVTLALGARLVASGVIAGADDAFFLEVGELLDLARGGAFSADARALVALRRAEHAALSRMDLPDTFTLPAGVFVVPETLGEAAVVPTDPGLGASLLRGVPASGGRVQGRAAVLGGLADADKLAPGDVLVAAQTDPGWAPLFFLVKGLVLERGGMLSHGSILARELGIPSVVGVPYATRRIAHGQEITLDGDAGHVRLV
jgi:phosphohistidine swiveling domain-containing protein